MSIETALARTLLLVRDEVGPDPPEGELVRALTTTRIALIADDDGLSTHAGQSCCVTAALLMARSGHAVHLLMPDVPMIGAQPPLVPGNLRASLIAAGNDLLPGVTFETGTPEGTVDLAVALGTAPIAVAARHAIRLRADGWRGMAVPAADSAPFGASWWPFGGMAAGALAAGEAFKLGMHKLAGQFRTPERLDSVFRLTDCSTFQLAPESTPYAHDIGAFDCISGGAIIHAALYALARVPGVSGKARIIEPETGDLSNLNRYMLMLRSGRNAPKAADLASMLLGTGLWVTPVEARFEARTALSFAPLAPSVLVGVDDIPSRWLVQRQDPAWLGVGATTHWSAMASFHEEGVGCAECLHPMDDPGAGPIPTVAFVSFWAGLLTASLFLRRAAGNPALAVEQQVFMTPFRAESVLRTPVPRRERCPSCEALQAHWQRRRAGMRSSSTIPGASA